MQARTICVQPGPVLRASRFRLHPCVGRDCPAPPNEFHVTPDPDPVPAATRRSILLLSFATFSSMCAQRICDAMLPELARVFSVGLEQAAHVVSFFAITYGLAQMFYGPVGDRLGKYRIVTLATFACSIGSVLAVLAGSLDTLVLARILMAAAAAGLIPLAMAWVGDSVPTASLQEMLTRTGLGSTLGLVAGQLIGGLLTDALGWRWCFVFLAVLFTAVGVFLYTDLRRQGVALFRRAPPAASAGPVVHPHFVRQVLGIVSEPWPRALLIMAMVEGAVGFGVLAIWASHLHARLGLSLTVAGAVVALFGLGGMLYMAVGRHVIRRFDQQVLVTAGGAIVGVCACVLAFAPHWLPAVPASLLAGFGFFMFHNTMQASVTDMAPQSRGTAVALFSSFLFLGQSVGVVLAAGLIGLIGSASVISGGGLVMALVGVLFALALRRREARPAP
ncbi:MAG: major facilitator superfamily 1 [Polaromonas sp.]|nr:major facilitator superfamily 1 [Polaromonas sp.]